MEMIDVYTLNKRKNKIKLRKDIYEPVKELIMSSLKLHREITLQRLIEIGEEKLTICYPLGISWLVVQVKNDLVYRGEVTIDIDEERNQLIRLRHIVTYFGRHSW